MAQEGDTKPGDSPPNPTTPQQDSRPLPSIPLDHVVKVRESEPRVPSKKPSGGREDRER
jgi:hypothetical protein